MKSSFKLNSHGTNQMIENASPVDDFLMRNSLSEIYSIDE